MKPGFFTWQQADAAGVTQCGGKGWNLARLYRFGFNVPDGGVLSSDVYQQLLANPVLKPLTRQFRTMSDDKLSRSGAMQQLETVRRTIVSAGLPAQLRQQLAQFLEDQGLSVAPLAVRSSATLEDGENTSFAGIHESYLNVSGQPAVEQAILNCFASLWTLRAVTYRRKMGIDDQALSCAVVIMVLVDARSSGIAFSCEPATGREDVTVINANFGLGESVVDGVTEPDEYRLSTHYMTLLSQKTGSKTKYTQVNINGGTRLVEAAHTRHEQVLPAAQVIRLGRLVQRVFWALNEKGSGQHQDIEWAFNGQEFFLLQARPVTALPRLTCDALRNQTDIWSNGNFRDAAPLVQSTLGVSLFSHQVDTILRAPFESIGYSLPAGLRFIKLFQGRPYCNSSLMQWLYFDSTGFLPAATNRSMGGHQQEIGIDAKARGGPGKKLRRGWGTVKLMRKMNRHKKGAAACIAKETAFANALVRADLTTLSDAELVSKLQLCDQRIEAWALPFIMLTARSGSAIMLFDLLEKYLPGKGTALATTLLAGAGNITSADHGYRLQDLAVLVETDLAAQMFFNAEPFSPGKWQSLPESSPFKQAFRAFIDEYGHRAVYEVYLNNPRWREKPDYLLNVIRQHIGGPPSSVLKAQQKQKAEQARQTLKKELPFYLRTLVKSLVKQAASGAASKEMAKSTYIRLFEPMRLLLLEAGRRFESRGLLQSSDEIFHCAYIEVVSLLTGEWNGKGIQSLIESRRRNKAALEKLSPPDLILGEQPHYLEPVTMGSGRELVGMGVAAGCAEGCARLIRTPEQGGILNPGDVLVAPSTDPAWTPLFLNAAAIVMETGGQLSHGAIVAREYGIPAVVNIPGLFNVIADGEQIFVDGDRGVIEKMAELVSRDKK